MRRLMIFALSFAGAVAAYLWLLPCGALWIAATALALSAALLFWKSDLARRIRIVALGAAVGLLWCQGYEWLRIEPMRALCGEDQLLTAQVIAYPEQTQYGCRVLSRVNGGRVMLYLDETGKTLVPSDHVTFRAEVVDVSDGGETDNLYFQSRDISLLAFQESELRIERAEKTPLWVLPTIAAKAMREKLTALFPADTEGFMRALLTGDHSGLSYELENRMSVTGISHIVAVSGMHVSMIVGVLTLLCFRRRRLAAGVGITAMVFFAAMLDFTPSVTRAVIMNSILLLAPLLRRENDAPTSLSAALLVILLGNPWALANLSLQLSFGAMAGIFLLTPRVYQRLLSFARHDHYRESHPFFARLVKAVAVSLSTTCGAMLFTTPRIATAFGLVSLISPLSNLLTMPILSAAFTGGFAISLVGFLFAPLAKAAAWVLSWGVRFVLWVVELLSRVPYAAVYTDQFYIAAWLVAAYVMIGVFLLRRGRRPRALLASIAFTLLVAVGLTALSAPECGITILDVGQGQCILLESGDVRVAVDCGGSDGEKTGEALARKLLMSGRAELDALILTHFDTDHIGGVQQLMTRVEIGGIYAPDIYDDSGNREQIERAATEAGVSITYVQEDLFLEFVGGSIALLAPETSFSDNDGLAALMSLEECDILITGDMDIEAERALLRSHDLPDLEILVAGHHGSKYSTGVEFLEQTMPELVVISVGENSYGHPTQEVLDRIAAIGAQVCRTDLDGEITILR